MAEGAAGSVEFPLPGELLEATIDGDLQKMAQSLRLGADSNETDSAGWAALHHAAEGGAAETVRLLIRACADVDIQVQPDGATAAFIAAQAGKLETLAALIAASADVTLATARGSTPLHAAIQFKHLDCAALLIKNGLAKLDHIRRDGWSPLHVAVIGDSPEIVSRLIHFGCPDVNIRDKVQGGCALHFAARHGSSEITSMLISAGGDVNTRRKQDGITALLIASEYDKVCVVRQLMHAGADVNTAGHNGVTPVYMAVQNNRVEIANLLIRAGAELDTRTVHGVTPLEVSIRLPGSKTIDQLIAAGAWLDAPSTLDGKSPLHWAVKRKDIATVNKLVQACANVDMATSAGQTPLYTSVEVGSVQATRLLIKASADVNIVEPVEGKSPLYVATSAGAAAMVDQLLAAGSNPDLKRHSGTSPLWIAAQKGFANLIAKLIEVGVAEPDIRGMSDSTPLYVAAQYGHSAAVDQLLKVTRDVDIPTSHGASPLYIAAEYGHYSVAKSLIQASANVDHEEKHGYTPIWTACQRGYDQVVELLLQAGAASDYENKAGMSPLRIAAGKGQIRAVEKLLQASAEGDAQDRSGCTVLWKAAESGQSDIVDSLIKAGADVNLQRSDGIAPMWIASQMGHRAIIEKLLATAEINVELSKKSGSSALSIASECGHADIAGALIQASADSNHRTRTGATPMHAAAQNGHADIALKLINAAAMVNVHRWSDGATPLWIASNNGHDKLVTQLLAAFADVDCEHPGSPGSPLWAAVQNGHTAIVLSLIRAGAAVDLPDEASGTTPISVAALFGHADIVQLLIAQSADVDFVQPNGHTPLYDAAVSGHTDVVKSLLQAGADDCLLSDEGSLLVGLAAQNGHANVVEAFFRARQKVQSSDRSSRTLQLSVIELRELVRCLEFCFYRGHIDFVLHFAKRYHYSARLFGHCGAALVPFFPDFSILMSVAKFLQPPDLASADVHLAMLDAGFCSANSVLQAGTAAVMEDIAIRRLGPGVSVVGSFADGWGNCLTRLCGRTDPDSDIDVTIIANTKQLHIGDGSVASCRNCENRCQPVDYEDGHIKYSCDVSCPTRPHRGSMLRPAFDNVNALPCCNYPPIQLLEPNYRTNISTSVMKQLRAIRDATQCHSVAASPPGLEGDRMRVSTNMLERALMQSLTSVQGQLFILLKYLIKRVISKRVSGLKTYHAKNLLFYMLDETPVQDWQPACLVQLVQKSLRMLIRYLEDSRSGPTTCMTHFFLRDAAVYLRKGRHNRRDIARAVSDVLDELPIHLAKYCQKLTPSETGAVIFHPFLLVPLSRRTTADLEGPSPEYHAIYDLVQNLLHRLGAEPEDPFAAGDTMEQLMLDICRLRTDWAGTARAGLTALARLKAGEPLTAAQLAEGRPVRHVRWLKRVKSAAEAKEFVWQQVSRCDFAWKFCFEAAEWPKFRFLPPSIRRAFPCGSGSYKSLFYCNFDALLKGLRLELFPGETPTAAELFEDAVAGEADPQELLLLLNFCSDTDILVRAIHANKDMITSCELNHIVVDFILNEPTMMDQCRQASLEALVLAIDIHGILEAAGMENLDQLRFQEDFLATPAT
ncbi:hypothetical protein BOX15_Mlig007069g1 [Macrostomum lignano]|uniref:Mab-21-like HhH/H2TH-like domain-containing protein n=1 Tax=Macrostomum lignano TaxID=282301 RepID=A0A267H8K9_9PLAT|nr:hypothetical protein BOX15_Mlig007069g1 [Macrostomum lignano]